MTMLVVFTHLRWDSVYQRLQQLLSRLAKRFLMLFVETCARDKLGVERDTTDQALLHLPHPSACAIV